MSDQLEAAVRQGEPRRWRVAVTTLLAAACVALACWVVWHELSARHEREVAAHFASESGEIALRIEERFRAYRAVLRSGRGLFALSGAVDRQAWHEFVESLRLDEDFPGIQGFGFTAWIQPEALESYVAKMRDAGHENFEVWPRGPRAHYSSIVMLEPTDWRNQRAIGYDMYSEPVRREAMDRAVRTGEAALSGKTTLVQETDVGVQAGVLIYAPVFVSNPPFTAEAEAYRALLGWVYMPFRMADLVHGVLGRYSEGVRLRIYDRAEAPENLLFDSHADHPPNVEPEFASLEHLTLSGREWLLKLEALPGYVPVFDARQAEMVAIVLVGVLFVIVTMYFSLAHERAKALAKTSESLRRSEARYSALVNLAQEGIASTDAQLRVTFANPSLLEMLGRDPPDVLGRALDEFRRDGAVEKRENVLARLRRGEGRRYEAEFTRPDERAVTALVSDAPLMFSDGVLKGAIVVVSDITERKDAERRIAHLATHDPLTGITNRLMFGEILSHAVDKARRYRHKLALLFVDLDRFKQVNDEFGHHVGDLLLKEVVRRTQASIRSSDTLGRRGGDEFVVLLPEIGSRHDVDVVAEKIRASLGEPFVVEGHELRISSSIGVAVYPAHGNDEDALLRRADEAMYRAKSEGRNCVRYATLDTALGLRASRPRARRD